MGLCRGVRAEGLGAAAIVCVQSPTFLLLACKPGFVYACALQTQLSEAVF